MGGQLCSMCWRDGVANDEYTACSRHRVMRCMFTDGDKVCNSIDKLGSAYTTGTARYDPIKMCCR
jgi:hypothetical protein